VSDNDFGDAPDWGSGYRDVEDPDVILEVYGTEPHALPKPGERLHGDDKESFTNCHDFTKGRPWNDVRHHACSGDNGMLMKLLTDDDEMPKVLEEVKRKLLPRLLHRRGQKKQGTAVGPDSHGLRCNHGRHRSKAVANLVRHNLKRQGFKVNIVSLSEVGAPCWCPCNCKKLKHNRCRQERMAIQEEWLEMGRQAFAASERMWDAV